MDVLVNAAMSVDGKLSTRRREQLAISGPEDFAIVEQLRAKFDAVMVGIGTVLADDPSLTIDDAGDLTDGQPARIIADSRARTPHDARTLNETAQTYLLCADVAPMSEVESLEATGATVIRVGNERVDLTAAFEELADRGVESILVEGGGELIFSLFEADLVDRLRIYVGSTVIGGRNAPTLADGEGFVENFPELSLRSVDRLDDGVALRYDRQ